ncbi:MAG: hypothetical protein ACI8UG_001048 [Gammaproteobacteria bacterium]|jgi:hypothetical protein
MYIPDQDTKLIKTVQKRFISNIIVIDKSI